jgi:hypothetical protein
VTRVPTRYDLSLAGGVGTFVVLVSGGALLAVLLNAASLRARLEMAGPAARTDVCWTLGTLVVACALGALALAYEVRRFDVWRRRDPGEVGDRLLVALRALGGRAEMNVVIGQAMGDDHARGRRHAGLGTMVNTLYRLEWLGFIERDDTGEREGPNPSFRINDRPREHERRCDVCCAVTNGAHNEDAHAAYLDLVRMRPLSLERWTMEALEAIARVTGRAKRVRS